MGWAEAILAERDSCCMHWQLVTGDGDVVDRQRQGAVAGAKLPLKPRSRVEVSQGFLEAPFPPRRQVIGGQGAKLGAFGGVVEAGGNQTKKMLTRSLRRGPAVA